MHILNIYSDILCISYSSGSGSYVFKIHQELYHHQGALLPEDGEIPHYAQLYIYDPSEALGFQQRNNDDALDSETLHDLQEMMQAHNPYLDITNRLWEGFRTGQVVEMSRSDSPTKLTQIGEGTIFSLAMKSPSFFQEKTSLQIIETSFYSSKVVVQRGSMKATCIYTSSLCPSLSLR